MGTFIDLTVGNVQLDWSKNSMGIDHGSLFQKGDLKRRETGREPIDVDDDDDDASDPSGLAFVRPLSRVLPRLNLLGHTIESARAEYDEAVREHLDMAGSIRELCTPPTLMTFEEYCEFCRQHPLAGLDERCFLDDPERERIAQGRFADLGEQLSRLPLSGYGHHSYWSESSFFGERVVVISAYSMLQVLGLDGANADAEVVWDFGELCASGWENASSFQAGARRTEKLLVATEGSTDSRVLARALEVLRSDVADFFRFVDADERHHFWGTGNLVKFAEGLVRIDVQNKVVFLLDNDAEGVDAHARLGQLAMPPNMRSMLLPQHDAFTEFPARGPEGVATCDINGRAAAIEAYLDLNLPGYPAARVVWSNYKRESDTWQGALEHKESYLRHFLDQDADAILDDGYDTSKLEAVLDALTAEAVQLAGSSPRQIRERG